MTQIMVEIRRFSITRLKLDHIVPVNDDRACWNKKILDYEIETDDYDKTLGCVIYRLK